MINGVCLIGASVVPFYLVFRAKISSLKVLSLLLGLFALSHGLYHVLYSFVAGGDFYPAREVFETVSVGALLVFAVYYNTRGGLA
jgi:uncharacterized membrane protein HdeD (DUF308 family)